MQDLRRPVSYDDSHINPPLESTMSLRINDTAPDFAAMTTMGPIRFHDWIGDIWACLFSHP